MGIKALANAIEKTVTRNYNKDYSIIQLLLKYGAGVYSLNKNGETLLSLIIRRRFYNNRITEMLLNTNADAKINAKDSKGNTALHYACLNNDIGTVKLLIKEGADIFVKNNLGSSPLNWAKGNSDVAKFLLNMIAGENMLKKEVKYL